MKNILQVRTRNELREWYLSHANSESECWVRASRSRGAAGLSYLDAVEEALCFGWIDSTCRKPSPDAPALQRFSPRRKGSQWTELNKERCRRLQKLGLMTERGRAVLPPMGPDSFAVEPWVEDALREDAEVYGNYLSQPDLYRRVRIYNIQFTDRRSGRAAALAQLAKYIEKTRKGELYGDWNDGGRLIDY